MSDPLSVAASVAGIVTIGFQIAKGLYDIADGIGTAGKEVRSFAGEIDAFSKLFARIRTRLLEDRSSSRNPYADLIKDILDVCDQTLEPLKRLQEKLSPLLAKYCNSSSKIRSLAFRIRWIFSSKDHMLSLRSILETQQRLLDTTLEMMTFEEVRDRQPQNINYFQISLNVSVQSVMTELRDQRPLQLQVAADMSRLRISDSNDTVTVEDVTDEPENSAMIPHGSSQALVQSMPSGDADVDHDVQAIVQDLDARVGDTAQDIWEDTRTVSRRVVKQAKAVLQASESTPRQNVDDWAAATETPVPATREPENAGRGRSTADYIEPPSISLPTAVAHPAEESRVLSPSPSHSAQASIVSAPERRVQFINADGKMYILPASKISTMNDLSHFIESLYPHGYHLMSNDRRKAVYSDEWDIYNEGGSILLPQFWESVGAEEEKIYFRFRDESLNTHNRGLFPSKRESASTSTSTSSAKKLGQKFAWRK